MQWGFINDYILQSELLWKYGIILVIGMGFAHMYLYQAVTVTVTGFIQDVTNFFGKQ